MGLDSEPCCDAVRQRMIPKVTNTENNGTRKKSSEVERKCNKDDSNGTKETKEERVIRIDKTRVTVMEFWNECLDWEMLRMFLGLFLLFLCMVGLASLLYLMFLFNFREKVWHQYFPISKREEL